ncbi:MAG: hypothetical protein ACI89J_001293 [Hyphomicrobiaceae bacterium]|jgi:hypothetical protein
MERLADHEHPLVRGTAATVTKGETTLRGKLDRLLMYVRDGIKFGFPYDGDLVKASDTIRLGLGQYNTRRRCCLHYAKPVTFRHASTSHSSARTSKKAFSLALRVG